MAVGFIFVIKNKRENHTQTHTHTHRKIKSEPVTEANRDYKSTIVGISNCLSYAFIFVRLQYIHI